MPIRIPPLFLEGLLLHLHWSLLFQRKGQNQCSILSSIPPLPLPVPSPKEAPGDPDLVDDEYMRTQWTQEHCGGLFLLLLSLHFWWWLEEYSRIRADARCRFESLHSFWKSSYYIYTDHSFSNGKARINAPSFPPSPPLPSPVPSPTEAPGDPDLVDNEYYQLFISAYPDGGMALQNRASPQRNAFEWLRSPTDLQDLSADRMLQRSALATFFYSITGWEWTVASWWLSNEHKCSWLSSRNAIEVCNPNKEHTELSLRKSDLDSTIPIEVCVLLDSLGKLGYSHTFSIYIESCLCTFIAAN
jgi:hypothetical protein